GVEGKLTVGPFRNVSDVGLLTLTEGSPTAGERQVFRMLSVAPGEDGTFRATGRDALPLDRYVAGTLLTDRQQRRQEYYQQFLKKPPAYLLGRTVLLAWADPIDTHVRYVAGTPRHAGDALLVVPLEYRPPAADAPRVTVPGTLVACRRVREGGLGRLT